MRLAHGERAIDHHRRQHWRHRHAADRGEGQCTCASQAAGVVPAVLAPMIAAKVGRGRRRADRDRDRGGTLVGVVPAPLGIGALAAEGERRDHGGKNCWFSFHAWSPSAASRDSRLILWIALITCRPHLGKSLSEPVSNVTP